MHTTITPGDMKRMEALFMERTGVTGETLMGRAAQHVADAVSRLAEERAGTVLCLCGTGNNGGDGLAAMRILCERDAGFRGECWLLPGRLSPDACRELERLEGLAGSCQGAGSVRVVRLEGEPPTSLPPETLCVIDAMFGTGLSRELSGMAAALCGLANRAFDGGVPVVAADIPSGLSGESGEVLGCAVRATETLAFHRPKPGLYLREGPDYAGCVTVADIGIPPMLPHEWGFAEADGGFQVMEARDLRRALPPRRRVSHKGDYGRVLLWAGSVGMAGAAAISATAALRAGAGLVTVACPEEIVPVVQTLCPCATCLPLPMGDAEAAWALLQAALARADALGAGCGLGQSEQAAALLKRLLAQLASRALPAVLDADALNLLAVMEDEDAPTLPLASVVFTPHPAEAARMLRCSAVDVVRDPVAAAIRLRGRFGASVIVKGAASVLLGADGGRALNPFGTPAMAKGGSGDALTGVLAALLAGRAAGGCCQGLEDTALLQAACALHGLAGEAAARRFGERGALATDLCAFLGSIGE